MSDPVTAPLWLHCYLCHYQKSCSLVVLVKCTKPQRGKVPTQRSVVTLTVVKVVAADVNHCKEMCYT